MTLYVMTYENHSMNGKEILAFSFNRESLEETVRLKNAEYGRNIYHIEMIPNFDMNKDVIPTFISNEVQ